MIDAIAGHADTAAAAADIARVAADAAAAAAAASVWPVQPLTAAYSSEAARTAGIAAEAAQNAHSTLTDARKRTRAGQTVDLDELIDLEAAAAADADDAHRFCILAGEAADAADAGGPAPQTPSASVGPALSPDAAGAYHPGFGPYRDTYPDGIKDDGGMRSPIPPSDELRQVWRSEAAVAVAAAAAEIADDVQRTIRAGVDFHDRTMRRQASIDARRLAGEIPHPPRTGRDGGLALTAEYHDQRNQPRFCNEYNGGWLRLLKAGRQEVRPVGCGLIDCGYCGQHIARRVRREWTEGYVAQHGIDAPTQMMTVTYPGLPTRRIGNSGMLQPVSIDEYIRIWRRDGYRIRPAPLPGEDLIDWTAEERVISRTVAGMNWNYPERVLWSLRLAEWQLAKWDTGNWSRLTKILADSRRDNLRLTHIWTREWQQNGQLHRHIVYRIPDGFDPYSDAAEERLRRLWTMITGYRTSTSAHLDDSVDDHRQARWLLQCRWYAKPEAQNYARRVGGGGNQPHRLTTGLVFYIAKYIAKDWNETRERRTAILRRAGLQPHPDDVSQLEWRNRTAETQNDLAKPIHSAMRRRGKSNDWGDASIGEVGTFVAAADPTPQTDNNGRVPMVIFNKREYKRRQARWRYWANRVDLWRNAKSRNAVITWRRNHYLDGEDEDGLAIWRVGRGWRPCTTMRDIMAALDDWQAVAHYAASRATVAEFWNENDGHQQLRPAISTGNDMGRQVAIQTPGRLRPAVHAGDGGADHWTNDMATELFQPAILYQYADLTPAVDQPPHLAERRQELADQRSQRRPPDRTISRVDWTALTDAMARQAFDRAQAMPYPYQPDDDPAAVAPETSPPEWNTRIGDGPEITLDQLQWLRNATTARIIRLADEDDWTADRLDYVLAHNANAIAANPIECYNDECRRQRPAVLSQHRSEVLR